MKVKKKGNLVDPVTWKKEVRCGHCTAVLEIDRSDLRVARKTEGDQWGPYEEIYHYVICPECDTHVTVKPPKFFPSMIPGRTESP